MRRYYVCIMASESRVLYVGTNDIRRREWEHKSNKDNGKRGTPAWPKSPERGCEEEYAKNKQCTSHAKLRDEDEYWQK